MVRDTPNSQPPPSLGADRVFTFTPLDPGDGGASLQPGIVNVQLPFLCHTMIVDNPTGQWYYAPGAFRFIPPYVMGVIIPFLGGTQIANLFAETPPGFTSAPILGETGRVTFKAAPMPGDSGLGISQYSAAGTFVRQGTMIDSSGTIDTGGTAQELVSAEVGRRYLIVINRSVEWLYLQNNGVDAVVGEGIPLAPAANAGEAGGVFTMESTAIDITAWSIIGATTGSPFTCYTMQ